MGQVHRARDLVSRACLLTHKPTQIRSRRPAARSAPCKRRRTRLLRRHRLDPRIHQAAQAYRHEHDAGAQIPPAAHRAPDGALVAGGARAVGRRRIGSAELRVQGEDGVAEGRLCLPERRCG